MENSIIASTQNILLVESQIYYNKMQKLLYVYGLEVFKSDEVIRKIIQEHSSSNPQSKPERSIT